MVSFELGATGGKGNRPALEVADIFRAYGDAYRQSHILGPEQDKVLRAIQVCRTAALGGHLDMCQACGYQQVAYNSCRNRHCPKCQSLAQAAWLQQRQERLLPTGYFHIVFTLPAELRAVVKRNRRQLFNLLFEAAADTLSDLGRDEKQLGAQLGITAVLHTWTRQLQFHPHVHCIVTGGGLTPSGDQWIAASGRYLFPVKMLAPLFRGKFLAGLAQLYEQGTLDLGGTCAALAQPNAFGELKDKLYRTDWVVYAKRPFGGPEQVFKYLGRYTHRVGISNYRLVRIDQEGVCFKTKKGKTTTVAPMEFIRRFLLHVLPPGFVKIRHYGLLAAGNVTTKLEAARRLLEAANPAAPAAPKPCPEKEPPAPDNQDKDYRDQLKELTGVDLRVCSRCQQRTMVRGTLPVAHETEGTARGWQPDSS